MKLTGAQIQRIQQVFFDAFTDYEDLARMMRIALDQNLPEIVERQALEGAVFELVEWSDRHDCVEELIRGAYEYRPSNLELQALATEIEQWTTLQPPASPASAGIPASVDPPAPTPRPLLPPSQIPIEEAPSVHLSALERQLLRIALAYYEQDVLSSDADDAFQKVLIEHKFGAGFSGAVVLLIDPGPGRAPIIAKIGPFGDLQQEYEAYQRLIRLAAPNIAASVLGPPWLAPDKSGLGILLYIYGSAPRRLPHSLLDYYQQVGGEKATAVLHNLLLEQGRELWGHKRQERFWLVQEYDRLLPVHLEVSRIEQSESTFTFEAGQVDDSELRVLSQGALVRLVGFTLVKFVRVAAQADRPAQTRLLLQAAPPAGKVSGALRILLLQPDLPAVGAGEALEQVDVRVDATRVSRLLEVAQQTIADFKAEEQFFPVQSELLPNPLLGLDALLDSRAQANWSTIHGDLNLQNILVDPPSGYARLIDFAETRHGPTLFDVHRLIVQVITKLLTKAVAAEPELGAESLSYLMHELHNSNPGTASPVPALQDVYVVLRALWQISSHFVDQYDGWRFFYNGLQIALLGALRFAELDQAARALVLVGAAKAKELANAPAPSAHVKPPAPGVTPYKGLMPFEQDDAAIFCGRATLTERVLAHLAQRRFLVLVGASGSGKSSLARAGLTPAFLRSASANQAARRAIVLTPTDQPLSKLAQALTGQAEGAAVAELHSAIRASSDGLYRFIQEQLAVDEAISGAATKQLLLLVDQMEELFTLCHDEAERRSFMDNLLLAAGELSSRAPQGANMSSATASVQTLVVCTLRADFYARFLGFESLRGALETNQLIVPPMTLAEFREVITGPAQTPVSAWYFEPGLVDQMIGDVGAEPGALPLLSHALLETWRRRSGRTLTLAGYQGAGRVQGAIAQTAEALYNKLTPAEQELTRRIFLALTELGEGSEDTRRRVHQRDLVYGTTAEQTNALLERLAQRRLITLSLEHVEVAHEALIRRWPRLQGWLEEDREGLRIERRLEEAARQWENSARDVGLLYRGVQLIQALEWARQDKMDLAVLVREFLAFSEITLAESEWTRGDLSYAQLHFQQAVELAPHLPQSHLALFDFLVDAGQLESAMAVYRGLLAQAGVEHKLLPVEFEVDSILDKSRLGLVFKAHQTGRTSPVAIALTPPAPMLDARLLAELRQSYLAIDSQYISRYLEIGRYGGRYFIVTEFVEGEALEEYLTRHEHLEAPKAFAMLDQIAHALQDAHARNLPHLSLNSSNILLTKSGLLLIRYGEERLVKTMLGDAANIVLPIPERYVAPEQFTGESATFASDIYALGMLASRIFAQQTHPVIKASEFTQLQPQLEEALSILTARACALTPKERYLTIQAMRTELQRITSAHWFHGKHHLAEWGLGWLTRAVTWVRSAGIRVVFVLLVILAAFCELWTTASALLPITRIILTLAFTVYPASLLFAWQMRDIAKNSGYASLVLTGSGMGVIIGLISAIWTIQNSAIDSVHIGFDLARLPSNYFPIFIIMGAVMTVIFVLSTVYMLRLSGRIAQYVHQSYLVALYSAFFLICLLILTNNLLMSSLGLDAMLNFPPEKPPAP